MSMQINKPRRNVEAVRLDLFATSCVHHPNFANAITVNGNIRLIRLGPGPINHVSASYDYVVSHESHPCMKLKC